MQILGMITVVPFKTPPMGKKQQIANMSIVSPSGMMFSTGSLGDRRLMA